LKEHSIFLYYDQPLPGFLDLRLRELFYSRILSFIQPIWLEAGEPAPFFPESDQIYLFVSLRRSEEKVLRHAIVNIPADKLPRFFKFEEADAQHIVFLDDILRTNLHCLFPGYEIHGVYSFKITRDSDLYLEEENFKKGIVKEIERKLEKRDEGRASRFLFESSMPMSVQQYLATAFDVDSSQLFEGGRYHHLSDLDKFPIHRPELEYPDKPGASHQQWLDCPDIFDAIEKEDILLHFPYHNYNPVLAFFNQAAIDTEVTAIYVTLYRIAADSHIANALISAARNKKKVVVFVELQARFDEANNLHWSREMESAGVQLFYSMPGIKVHSKVALVEKKDGGGYGFVGTGNFNEQTARFYTDHALLTRDQDIVKDLRLFFLKIDPQNDSKAGKSDFKTLLVSQYNMVDGFTDEIERQIRRQKKGKAALIRIKLNNLEDPGMIDLLYKASKAGVRVELIIRSICCLRPGLEELSDNITVRRIVDRYLEHSRIFIFGTNEDCRIFMGSADWMNRNLHRRIEVCAPIMNPTLKEELLTYFQLQWKDCTKTVQLDSTAVGAWLTPHAEANSPQQLIYEYLRDRS